MTQKVEESRRAIADIEAQATRIKEEIKMLIDNDERMTHDEAYRNQVIGERLKEVQKLQDLSQVHQRTIMQQRGVDMPHSQRKMSTRSSSSASATLSSVALNMQQMTRMAARALPPAQTGQLGVKKATEGEQKASVIALHKTRNWIVEKERYLLNKVENQGLEGFENVSVEDLEQYALFSSLRVWTESLCIAIRKNPSDEASVEELRDIIKFVSSFPTV